MPLVTATGAGAASRQILGTTVIGGMLAASLIAIFIIPVSLLRRRAAGKSRRRWREASHTGTGTGAGAVRALIERPVR